MSTISFVDISSYSEKRMVYKLSLEDYMKILREQADYDNKFEHKHDNANKSILECLTDENVRLYLDIENIQSDNDELVNEIVSEFAKYYGLGDYAMTFNPNSHHEGRSYHIFFNVKTTKSNIFNMIVKFNVATDFKYSSYIDHRIYGKNRLFRAVGSICPMMKFNEPRRTNDYHRLIKGNLEDTIIQNIDGLITYGNNYVLTIEMLNQFKSAVYQQEKKDSVEGKKHFSISTKAHYYFTQKHYELLDKISENLINISEKLMKSQQNEMINDKQIEIKEKQFEEENNAMKKALDKLIDNNNKQNMMITSSMMVMIIALIAMVVAYLFKN